MFHWKASGNKLKTFHYFIESAAAFIAIHSNIQALSFLNDVDNIIREAEAEDDDESFFITAEDKARVEFLRGQVMKIFCFDKDF